MKATGVGRNQCGKKPGQLPRPWGGLNPFSGMSGGPGSSGIAGSGKPEPDAGTHSAPEGLLGVPART